MSSYFNRGKIKLLGNTDILGLGEIIRYNNRPKIKNENVAEHTFYVTSTVLKICQMFNLSDKVKHKALEFAVVHDIPELLIGDVPYDTKVNNPLLREAVEKAEVEALKNNLPEYYESYCAFLKEEKEETVEYLVTKLADTVSVLQYSNRELDLGNKTTHMIDINEESEKRVHDLIEKLESKISQAEEAANDEVIISREEYLTLQRESNKLNCLEVCGVDNWCGYSDAIQMMFEGDNN